MAQIYLKLIHKSFVQISPSAAVIFIFEQVVAYKEKDQTRLNGNAKSNILSTNVEKNFTKIFIRSLHTTQILHYPIGHVSESKSFQQSTIFLKSRSINYF